jgi:DNA adenine methylase
VDAQGDTISSEEIRQAAHKFMEDFGNLGLQHKTIVNGKLKLLESFIAPVDFDVDGESVKQGTWLMAERVVDDELWTAIRKGEITGFSIGGSAIRRKV